MKKTMIVVIPVDEFDNGREIADDLNGTDFLDTGSVWDEFDEDKRDIVGVYSVPEFVDLMNEQVLTEEGHWFAYVFVKE